QVDDDTGAFPLIGFIVDMSNAFDDLFIHQLAYAIAERVTVDLVRHFRNDDLFPAAGLGVHMQLAAKNDTSSAEVHGCLDTFHAVDDTSCREVGRFDMFDQLFDRNILIVDVSHTAVDGLGEVMGHHIGGHTDGNTAGTVYQQLGYPRGQNGRF